ncbi:MAG: hypothetical protein K2N67_04575 [Mucispirillum sp.]|nr:hypothetical protein [Mucispirillum sp.]
MIERILYFVYGNVFDFQSKVSQQYDAAQAHLRGKQLGGSDLLVFAGFGVVAGIFLIFLVFSYLKEKGKKRY